jgi:hypothetical protein
MNIEGARHAHDLDLLFARPVAFQCIDGAAYQCLDHEIVESSGDESETQISRQQFSL